MKSGIIYDNILSSYNNSFLDNLLDTEIDDDSSKTVIRIVVIVLSVTLTAVVAIVYLCVACRHGKQENRKLENRSKYYGNLYILLFTTFRKTDIKSL